MLDEEVVLNVEQGFLESPLGVKQLNPRLDVQEFKINYLP